MKLHFEKKPLLALLGAAVLGIGGLTALIAQAPTTSPNLITMLQDLGGTTSDMLANTESLQGEVSQVQTKLGQLNAQEAILQQQEKTGADLQAKLAEQEQLTSNGVALMEQILQREQTSVDSTTALAQQAQAMNGDVEANAATLTELATALNTANNESNKLNGQMDALLLELAKSKDSFKLFGTVFDILQDPLNLPNTLQKLNDFLKGGTVDKATGGLLGGLGSTVGDLIPNPTPSNPAPATPASPDPENPVGGLLGNLIP
ncbi:hypothetical protein JJB07_01380 [Tumebacillus sp. ITR2]|uniref:Uncharacterized protein n=1 Tax=Tumebacillus amylolyticus TaxID=2801339 RepID=A0ABS1J4T0_9BACL|nr:hypothetical protein [Tumebacillus amylolyticus]MBL0385284.1 hypothetical protein [Tumebacillus amylolyticus]